MMTMGKESGRRLLPVSIVPIWRGKAVRRQSCAKTVARRLVGNLMKRASGVLQKIYADSKGPSYEYNRIGQVTQRTWTRGITTTHRYDKITGALVETDYSDQSHWE